MPCQTNKFHYTSQNHPHTTPLHTLLLNSYCRPFRYHILSSLPSKSHGEYLQMQSISQQQRFRDQNDRPGVSIWPDNKPKRAGRSTNPNERQHRSCQRRSPAPVERHFCLKTQYKSVEKLKDRSGTTRLHQYLKQ